MLVLVLVPSRVGLMLDVEFFLVLSADGFLPETGLVVSYFSGRSPEAPLDTTKKKKKKGIFFGKNCTHSQPNIVYHSALPSIHQ